jgi:hypothetical protein
MGKKQKYVPPVRSLVPAGPARPQKFLKMQVPDVPSIMTNVVSVFVQGIPGDSYGDCGVEVGTLSTTTGAAEARQKLAEFVRGRLELLARLEYASWINGQIPFVTSRELQIWRLLQFVTFIWFWDLPDDEILALIFNATRRRASSLASDFEARFRKTVLYPVALRRLYELFSTEPISSDTPHPRHNWEGCLYRIHSDRYLSYTMTLIDDMREFKQEPLIDAMWYDQDEKLMWLPMEVRKIATTDAELREKLFEMYHLPRDAAG